jgi:hypothetical protein
MGGKADEDAAALKKSSRDEAIAANKRYYELKPELAVSEEAPAPSLTQMKFDMPSLRAATGNLEMPSPNGTTNIDMGFNMPKMPGEYNQQTTANLLLPGVNRAELKMKGLNREEKNKLLDEFAMSDNPYLVSLSERIAAKEKPEFVPGDKEGIYQLVNGKLVNVVEPRPDAADVPTPSKLAQLQRERARIVASGAKPGDPLLKQYDDAINIETTRAAPISISTGDRTDRVLSDVYAADLGDLRTKKNSAQNILSIIGEIRAIPAGKLYSGPIADLKTTAASYLEAIGLGGIDNDKIANSQEYQAKIADLGISKIKGALGINPTDRDLEYVKMTLPLLTKVPAARARLLDLLEKRAKTDIGNYKSATTHYRKYNNLDEWSPPGARTATGIPTQGFNQP